MKQKGFATILGLCLILAAALIVRGISDAETNHAYDASSFLAEQELQNAAYEGIHRAAKKVLEDPNILPKNNENVREKKQARFRIIQPIKSEHFGRIIVDTWGELINIQNYTVNYNDDSDDDGVKENIAKPDKVDPNFTKLDIHGEPFKEAYYFFSRASVDAKNINGKFYRRATAYILKDDPNKTIHYLELPMSSYKFAK